jgi:hypothetical protein
LANKLASENLETAEIYQDASMNWGGMGRTRLDRMVLTYTALLAARLTDVDEFTRIAA